MLDLKGWRATALSTVCALALAAPAHAAPILYQYVDGQATVTASSPTAGTLGVATFTLNGIFAEFDSDTGALTDFQFTTTENQSIVLTAVYGGFDEVIVNSASVIPGPGYLMLASTQTSPGIWSIAANPIQVNAVYTGITVTNVAIGPFPLTYPTPPAPSPLSATININNGTFTLEGITLGVVPVTGEAPVTVGAVLTFQGAIPVPEPTALGLLAIGGAFLALARKR